MPSSPARQRRRRPLPWDAVQCQALALIFEGRKSRDAIALDCAVPARTLDDWIAHPDFQARLTAMREDILRSLSERGVAYVRKEQRIIAASQMAESARGEYEARPWLQEKRQIGFDRDAEEPLYLINESFNRDAFDAFRGALDDIAKELGHRRADKDAAAGPTLNIAGGVVLYMPQPEAPPPDAPQIVNVIPEQPPEE